MVTISVVGVHTECSSAIKSPLLIICITRISHWEIVKLMRAFGKTLLLGYFVFYLYMVGISNKLRRSPLLCIGGHEQLKPLVTRNHMGFSCHQRALRKINKGTHCGMRNGKRSAKITKALWWRHASACGERWK